MSLSVGQQRILDAIAGSIQVRDPRLAGMFAVFTRLTRSEPMPVREAIGASRLRRAADWIARAVTPRRRLPALILIPTALAALAALVMLGPVNGRTPCGSHLSGRAVVQLAGRFSSCAGPAGAGRAAGNG